MKCPFILSHYIPQMDKFLVSFGLGGVSPHTGSGDTAKTASSTASPATTPNSDASDYVTPKKVSFSLFLLLSTLT